MKSGSDVAANEKLSFSVSVLIRVQIGFCLVLTREVQWLAGQGKW